MSENLHFRLDIERLDSSAYNFLLLMVGRIFYGLVSPFLVRLVSPPLPTYFLGQASQSSFASGPAPL